ncbi:MAG: PAS domain S-box protein [Proteobacteria bacterium]|nr:PAS domain S-box protein [Pseudomonadota bacterium]
MKTDQGSFELSPNILKLLILGYGLLISIILVAIWLFDDTELVNLFVHSAIETSGAVASIAIAVLIFILLKQNQYSQSYAFLAYGFMSMGVLDILHASVSPGSLFVWLHSSTALTGGLFFACTFLPGHFSRIVQKTYVFIIATVTIILFGIASIYFREFLPLMLDNGRFTPVARSFNVVGGLLFCFAFYHFLQRLKAEKSLDDFIFMNLCLLFGLAGFLFEASQIWHLEWWAWHVLRLVAHFLIIYYLFFNYYRTTAKLILKIAEHDNASKLLKEKTFDLGERVKELNCLYGITELMENENLSLEEVLEGVANLIPPSWQYPDITGARIVFDHLVTTTSRFKDTSWKQSAPISINNQKRGVLEVCYLEEKPDFEEGPFLEEERALIDSIVKLLGKAIERKVTAEELKLSEQKYRQLFDSITYGYAIHEIITDEKTGKPVDYRFLDLNKAFNDHTGIEASTGLKSSEIIGKTILEIMPETEDFWIQKYGDVALTGNPIEFEAPSEALGKFYQVHAFQNQPGQFAVMFSDVTERRKAEADLRKLSQAVEQSGSAIVITDINGTIEFANPIFYENTGYSPKDVIGQNPRILQSGEHQPEFYQKMWQTISQGGVWRGILTNRKRNGELYWEAATISPVTDWNGEVTHYVAVKDDITERKKIEQKLVESKNRYQEFVEGTSDLITRVDKDGVFEFVNHMSNKIYGISPEECIGRLAFDFIHPEDQDFTREWFAKIVKKSQTFGTIENRQVHVDGQVSDMLWTVNFIYDDDGKMIGANSIARNISERKTFENELKSAQKQAVEANQAKSAFLANMSHELRTPLNSILGFTQILEKQLGETLNDKQRKFFNTLKNSGNHLLEMVNDILDLSKVEAGKIETDLKPFDLGDMLRRSIIIMRETAHEKQIRIEENIQPDLGWINGDETRLKQVIFNLLSNAVKFTAAEKKIGLDASGNEQGFTITVWDEGEGIAKEDLDTIFNPFEQAKSVRGANEQGTGLGLSISRRLVQIHQGTLEVSSQLGKGSRFTVSLPGRIPVESQSGDDLSIHPKHESRTSAKHSDILIVEDNKPNRDLLEVALENYRLDFAVSAEEALNMTLKNEYDLILMDIQLPKMNGTEAMKQIKQRDQRHVPIVALTSFAMKGDQENYLAAGFDDYLSKPIDIDILIRKIENLLH